MSDNLNILLVEDNPGDAFLVKFYLEESIFKNSGFVHVESLQSALDNLSKGKTDVVLLDLNLPDSNGVNTVKSILSHSKDVVVIVLTGLADNELGVQTVKLGAQDFLVKGQFDGKVLTSSIRYAFERAQLKQKVRELDERIVQYSDMQEIAKIGYFEINLESKSLKLSSFLSELIGYNTDSFDDFMDKLSQESKDALNNLLKTTVGKQEGFQLNFNLKDSDTVCMLRAKYSSSNLIKGTLQVV